MEEKKLRLMKSKSILLDLVKESYPKVVNARDIYLDLNESYLKLKKKYEETDRELAMLRRTVLPPMGTGRKAPPPPPQLTIEQVKSIANRLGIKIATEGGED